MCSLFRPVILFVAAVTFLATDQVFAQPANIPSGFQIVLDGSIRMINKDVQQPDGTLERWAIMYDPARVGVASTTPGVFLGNVFRATGGEPARGRHVEDEQAKPATREGATTDRMAVQDRGRVSCRRCRCAMDDLDDDDSQRRDPFVEGSRRGACWKHNGPQSLLGPALGLSPLGKLRNFSARRRTFPGVKAFVDDLPPEVRADLDRVLTFDGDELFKGYVQNLRDNSFHYPHPDLPALREALHAGRDFKSEIRVAGRIRDLRAPVGDHMAGSLLFPDLEYEALRRFNERVRDLHMVLCQAVPIVVQAYAAKKGAELRGDVENT